MEDLMRQIDDLFYCNAVKKKIFFMAMYLVAMEVHIVNVERQLVLLRNGDKCNEREKSLVREIVSERIQH